MPSCRHKWVLMADMEGCQGGGPARADASDASAVSQPCKRPLPPCKELLSMPGPGTVLQTRAPSLSLHLFVPTCPPFPPSAPGCACATFSPSLPPQLPLWMAHRLAALHRQGEPGREGLWGGWGGPPGLPGWRCQGGCSAGCCWRLPTDLPPPLGPAQAQPRGAQRLLRLLLPLPRRQQLGWGGRQARRGCSWRLPGSPCQVPVGFALPVV